MTTTHQTSLDRFFAARAAVPCPPQSAGERRTLVDCLEDPDRWPVAAASLLAELGYRIDSSMRSAYDYSDEGGPDFSAVPNHAFHLGELVELPFTTVFTGRLRRGGARLHRNLAHLPKGIGIASRLGLLSRVALTPEDMPLDEAKEAVRIAVGEGLRLLNFAFHSPSVEPGHTPYVRTEADLAAFLRWWEEVLALLDRLGVRSASVDEIVAAACRPA